jgi:hypothetical protein
MIAMQSTINNDATTPRSTARAEKLIDWCNGPFNARSSRTLAAHHRLHEMDLFSDEVLIDLLDRYPRNRLQAWTMGTDRLHHEDWQAVDTTGVCGKDLLAAVKSGRIWYNILRLDLFDKRYKEIVDGLYSEMAVSSPGFTPLSAVGTLLLSSPNAMVYYHADGPPTTLFHVRGYKRMWLYPLEERFVSQHLLEEIFGSAMDEEIPYSPEFDQYADVFDLGPGDLVWWPQNWPHRIENLDSLNVSLSTRYHTDDSERRKLVYNANRFFRRKLGLQKLAVKETGTACEAKCLAYRLCRRVGWDRETTGYVYTTNLRVDPNASLGLARLPEAVRPPFSR